MKTHFDFVSGRFSKEKHQTEDKVTLGMRKFQGALEWAMVHALLSDQVQDLF